MLKIGDIVYQVDNGGIVYKSEIKSIYFANGFTIYDCGKDNIAFDERAVGENVFLTK